MALSKELAIAAAQLQAMIDTDTPASDFDLCAMANLLTDWAQAARVLEELARPDTFLVRRGENVVPIRLVSE